jgi:hypothetical protein
MSVGIRAGNEYSSNVNSTFTNGNWSTSTGTAKTADIDGITAKIVGTSAYSTTVNGASVSGSSSFKSTGSYDDKIARNYSLNAQGEWVFTNKTFEGELNTEFEKKFKVENQQYVVVPEKPSPPLIRSWIGLIFNGTIPGVNHSRARNLRES